MKKTDLVFSVILVPLDFLMLLLAGLLPYFLRKQEWLQTVGLFSPIFYSLPFWRYLGVLVIFVVLGLIIFALSGLYNINYPRKLLDQLLKVFIACSAGMMLVIIFIFFKREFLFSSRFIILASWAFVFIFLSFNRIAFRIARRLLLYKNIGTQQAVIVGKDQNSQNLVKELTNNCAWGYVVSKTAPDLSENSWQELNNYLKKNKIDEIIIADLTIPKEEIAFALDFCVSHHLGFRYGADIFSTHLRNVEIDTIAGMPFIEIRKTALHGWGNVVKRILDFILAFILTILLLPAGIVIAVLIKLDTKGPMIVRLERVGQRGKKFYMYKFRSMVLNADKLKSKLLSYNERSDGPLFKIKNDPRITPFGKILRRFSLDELPQVFNVLKGEMSLVGPRPHEPGEVAEYQEKQRQLLLIKPGITGMAQISGRSSLVFEEEVRLDTYYIENWSLMLDLYIFLKTSLVVWGRRKKGAC